VLLYHSGGVGCCTVIRAGLQVIAEMLWLQQRHIQITLAASADRRGPAATDAPDIYYYHSQHACHDITVVA